VGIIPGKLILCPLQHAEAHFPLRLKGRIFSISWSVWPLAVLGQTPYDFHGWAMFPVIYIVRHGVHI
jgi:hypothetical protein